MCRNKLKNEIRDDVATGALGNGWHASQSIYANRAYTVVFTKNYFQCDTVERATIALTLDANGDIRCYPHLSFREARTMDWRAEFYNRYRNEVIAGIVLRSAAHGGATKTGIAVNAVLQNQSWRNWAKPFPVDAISTLRECCAKMCKWVDEFVG